MLIYLKITISVALFESIRSSCVDISKTKCAGTGFDSISFDYPTVGNVDSFTAFQNKIDDQLSMTATVYSSQCEVEIKADSAILKASTCYGLVFGSLDLTSGGNSIYYGKCNNESNSNMLPNSKKVCKSSCESLAKSLVQFFKDKGCKDPDLTNANQNVTKICSSPFITTDESNCLKISGASKSYGYHYFMLYLLIVWAFIYS